MLDAKRIEEAKRNAETCIKRGAITKVSDSRFVQFFLDNARNSLDSALLLFGVSTDKNLKASTGFRDFNGFLWVINASYYSMFYMARALLEKEGIKIKTEDSVHAVTFDALVYYFYLTGKLQKRLVEDFADAEEDATRMLGREKARGLMEDYFHERRKRAKFTYEMGLSAMQNKAKTSLERANRFNEETRKMI